MHPTMFRFIGQSAFKGEEFFRNRPIRNNNYPWWSCLLANRDEMSIFLEDVPRMLPAKCWFIWESSFRGEDCFRNRPMRKNNYPWWPCLLTNRDEMSSLYRGRSNDASYQILVYLGKQFQRSFFQKSTNQKQELPVTVMFVNGSGRNELSLQRTS